MEKFKKTLQIRVIFSCIYNAVVFVLLASGVIHKVTGGNECVSDFIWGFNVGLCVGVQIGMLYYLGKYIAAVKNEEKLKQLYIAENDERSIYIDTRTGGFAINLIILGITLGTVVSGYFSQTVFITLLSVTIFCITVKLILKMYYNKKF